MNEIRQFLEFESLDPWKRPEVSPDRKAAGKAEYEKKRYDMIRDAILKHLESVSYRAFRVASSVLAENKHVKNGYEVHSQHNFKPWEHAQHGWDKLCAEPNACSDVIVRGAEYIPAIIVTSQHKEIGDKPEDDTHTDKALHSCRNCRQLFRELIKLNIMSDDTIIRFVDDSPLLEEDFNNIRTYAFA